MVDREVPIVRTISVPETTLSDGVVRLRAWREQDSDAVVAICSDPEIRRWTRVPDPFTVQAARDWIEGHPLKRAHGVAAPFAVDWLSSGELVGSVGLSNLDWGRSVGEVYYWVAPDYRRRHTATRAVRLLSDWALGSLGLRKLEILAHMTNGPSHGVALRSGYVSVGFARVEGPIKGELADLLRFTRCQAGAAGPDLGQDG